MQSSSALLMRTSKKLSCHNIRQNEYFVSLFTHFGHLFDFFQQISPTWFSVYRNVHPISISIRQSSCLSATWLAHCCHLAQHVRSWCWYIHTCVIVGVWVCMCTCVFVSLSVCLQAYDCVYVCFFFFLYVCSFVCLCYRFVCCILKCVHENNETLVSGILIQCSCLSRMDQNSSTSTFLLILSKLWFGNKL